MRNAATTAANAELSSTDSFGNVCIARGNATYRNVPNDHPSAWCKAVRLFRCHGAYFGEEQTHGETNSAKYANDA